MMVVRRLVITAKKIKYSSRVTMGVAATRLEMKYIPVEKWD